MSLDKIRGSEYKVKGDRGEEHTFESYIPHSLSMKKSKPKHKALERAKHLEASSKKAGFYVHGHKNYGDVYEA